MGAVREVYALFGLEYDPKGEKEAEHGIKNLKEGFEAVAAVFTGSELFRGISEFAEQVGRTGELAEQLHVGTDELQLFQYAAEVSGSSTEELNASLSILQKSLGHAEAATSPQVEALNKLHIQAKDTAGNVRNMSDILPEVFDNFGDLKSEADEAAVATALFGRAGVRLLPTLRNGQEGLKALSAEMGEYGGPISKETIEASKQMADDLKRLDHAWLTFKGSLAGSVLPQVSKAVEWFGKTVAKLGQWTQGTTLANTATYALAGTIAVKLGTALAPYLKSGLKFGAIFLAIDDLIGFLQGKDSLIGRLLDKAFGPGTQENVRAFVNGTIDEFGRMWSSAEYAWDQMGNGSATFTQKAMAAFVSFVRDAQAGFPLVSAGWDLMLANMFLSIDKFVLDAETKWNSLMATIAKVAAIGAKVLALVPGAAPAAAGLAAIGAAAPAATVDTGAASARVENDTASQGQAQARLVQGVQDSFGRKGQKSAADVFAPAELPGVKEALAFQRAQAALPGGAAAGKTAAALTAAVAAPPAAAAGPNVTIDARTTVTVQGDADKGTADDVARRVARTAADAHRRAGQSLVQRKAT